MLICNLITNDTSEIAYRYYPEVGKEFGIVKYSKLRKRFYIEKLADNDESKIYAKKMIKKLKEMVKEDKFPRNGIYVWD